MKKNQKTGAAKVSIFTASFLAFLKIIIFFFSGSLAVLASALDSFLDSFISLANFFAINAADKPPDKEHSFGHGKIEALASLFQGLIIVASGFYLFYESIYRIFYPQKIEHSEITIAVMIFSLVASFFLSRFLAKTAKDTDSSVLEADNLHFTMDFWTNLAIIAVLFINYFYEILWLDAVLGFALALFIYFSAVKLLKNAIDILIDSELPNEIRNQIISKIENFHPEISSFHELRTRRAGSQKFIDFHLVFNEKISLIKAHEIAENLMDKIKTEIPNSNVLIHLDPEDDRDKQDVQE